SRMSASPPPHIPTLSLPDALPIFGMPHTLHRGEASLLSVSYGALAGATDRPLSIGWRVIDPRNGRTVQQGASPAGVFKVGATGTDRKSTRLNSSHQIISYAVFCLK